MAPYVVKPKRGIPKRSHTQNQPSFGPLASNRLHRKSRTDKQQLFLLVSGQATIVPIRQLSLAFSFLAADEWPQGAARVCAEAAAGKPPSSLLFDSAKIPGLFNRTRESGLGRLPVARATEGLPAASQWFPQYHGNNDSSDRHGGGQSSVNLRRLRARGGTPSRSPR